MRGALQSAWDWLRDLGNGAWVLIVGLVLAVAVVVALITGRSGPQQSGCGRARPYVDTLQQLAEGGRPLTSVQVARLQSASAQLTAIARTAYGDDTRAIQDAARTAGSATAGRPLEAVQVVIEFEAACPSGGLGNS